MNKSIKSKFTCFVLVNRDKESQLVTTVVNEVVKELNGTLVNSLSRKIVAPTFDDLEANDITKADLIFVDISKFEPENFYDIGRAHAMGKPVIFLSEKKFLKQNNVLISNGISLEFELSKDGLINFKESLKFLIKDFLKNPSRFRRLFPYIKKAPEGAYIVDVDKLEPREYENLCFELISQMGFKKVTWGLEMNDIDLIATLPKKDPDGFEYQELWLITMGNKAPSENLLENVMSEPEILLDRLFRYFDTPDLFSKSRSPFDEPITFLFILKEGQESVERRINKAEIYIKRRRHLSNIRFRVWNSNYLTKLIQTYPQISYKYFSEQSRSKSKYRKSSEELYNENIKLTEDVLRANAIIEEEKRKRFIAERETAWRDVAFKAAHKLGNPVDATDTYLQSLKRKLLEGDINKAVEIANLMDISIEEAKLVIGQFKSLTKIEEIKAQPYDIVKLIKNSCKAAEENGVKVDIETEKNLPEVNIDPEKTTECFNELVANALHWFDKEEKSIKITVKKVRKEDAPEPLHSKNDYLKIIFQDNGCGIPIENKEKIFSPFFSTYQHGSGLGLSLNKKVIELQGGWISENGVLGQCSSFEIHLPIAKAKVKKV